MIRIIAAMGRKIERDRQALLPRREIAPVEGVRNPPPSKARILAHGPGLVDVHRRVGAAKVGRDARIGIEKIDAGAIVWTVDGLHGNAFGR